MALLTIAGNIANKGRRSIFEWEEITIVPELSAVTGVDGNKMGVTENTNKSNMRETQREFLANVVKYNGERYGKRHLLPGMQSPIWYRRVDAKVAEPGSFYPIEQVSIDMRNLQFGVFRPKRDSQATRI